MKNNANQPDASERPGRGKILPEALAVLAVGIILALTANRLSPRGLVLTRNYFPAGTRPPVPSASGPGLPGAATNAPAFSPEQALDERLKAEGLQLIDGRRATQLFHDPRFQQGKIVFIDARDEARYRAGHIPGAYEFDPYHPEQYFPAALPACQGAEQIVVYCHGGDCDDSESAALTLRDVGIAVSNLYIYGGGMTEWATNGQPVEVGPRNSGTLSHEHP